MDPHLDTLARELTALTQRFVDLGARLGDAARALEEVGAPPADGLVEDLAGARSQFLQLRTDALTAAEAASVPPTAEPESLTDLEPVLGAVEAALRAQAKRAELEQARARVVAILDRVLELVHRDDPDFAALAGCQARARTLRDAVMALNDPDAPAVPGLGAACQSYVDLLTMIASPDAADDARYAQLEEAVSRSFGRSVAVAVARGKLAFASDIVLEPPPPSEPEPAEPEPERAAPGPELVVPVPEVPEPGLVMAEPEPAPVSAAPTIEMPPPGLEHPIPEPVAAMPEPMLDSGERLELATSATPAIEPELAPAAATPSPVAAPPSPAAPAPEPAEPSPPDDTAQWWLAAWARWSGWKSTHDFTDVVRDELRKYPYLLAVPIQKSPEYEEGLLAYGYSILLDHVEKQTPGCVGNALNSLKPGERRPVGEQLYDYLVAEGRLQESYPQFVRNVLMASVPEPGLWFQFRILESREDTRIFQRASARLGESELSGQRLASDGQRYAEHKFKMTLAPLTTRCVLVSADMLRDARGVGVKIVVDGQPADSGWIATVPQNRRGKAEARRVAAEGTHVTGLGKDLGAVWIAVFNADPRADRRYELSVFLRKDTRSPFRRKA